MHATVHHAPPSTRCCRHPPQAGVARPISPPPPESSNQSTYSSTYRGTPTHAHTCTQHARTQQARTQACTHAPASAHTTHTRHTADARAHTHTTLHSHATLHTLHSTFPFRGVVVIFINPTFAAISALVVVAGPEVLLCAHEPRGVSLAECRFVQFQCAGVVVADPACCVGVGGWLVVDKASAQLLTVAQVLAREKNVGMPGR